MPLLACAAAFSGAVALLALGTVDPCVSASRQLGPQGATGTATLRSWIQRRYFRQLHLFCTESYHEAV